ncbi:hypothetical protein SEA_LUCKYSOCKE_139 [Streptomyces phage LuckySocke]|nr:hypothetical protein SEA_ALONE_144 [Streptomyces phage Alone3]WPH58929.1 hypothetical protein SEA_LUCKYSOCKE_139 [Streptomyces phage LuckySocke]
MAKYDPFKAKVEPLDPAEGMVLLPLALGRSFMWDMVGEAMIKSPEEYGQSPASDDVLELEYRDMVLRNRALEPFGPNIDMACHLATAAAVKALSVRNPALEELSEEDLEKLTAEHTQVSTMVTKAVLGQMMSKGMIHYGVHG